MLLLASLVLNFIFKEILKSYLKFSVYPAHQCLQGFLTSAYCRALQAFFPLLYNVFPLSDNYVAVLMLKTSWAHSFSHTRNCDGI